MIIKTAEQQGDKIGKDTMEKVKKKANSRLVVVVAKGGKDLTVIDGVHRAVRICLHYKWSGRINRQGKFLNKHLGQTPSPIRDSDEEWSRVPESFHD
jgi:hypothetical protein